MEFPTSKKELERLGWDYVDVILITGDAFIDHPSFGVSVIAHILQAKGYRVAVVPQPNWRDDLRDFKKMGKPRLFFGISSGSMDSMVNHYTPTKRLRSDDAYTPGGLAGQRPDYAVVVYSKIVKELFPDVPIVIGGIESSLRRLTHYDYWSNSVKPSILIDSKADMLVYGMGEKAILEIAEAIQTNNQDALLQIPQTAYCSSVQPEKNQETIVLASHEECTKNKKVFAEAFKIIEQESNAWTAKKIVQQYNNTYIVVNRPFELMTTAEIDAIYALPFSRMPHSRYAKKPPIPAFEMIKHSITMHRGCFGGCSFCTISAHQGKFVVSRSEKSVLQELEKVKNMPYFKGHITDLGGPSANMFHIQGKSLALCKVCRRASCLFPSKCQNLNDSHKPLLQIYGKAKQIQGIKHLTIGSGIRLDLVLGSKDENEYIKQIVMHHVSGRLKVAPEHTENDILQSMRKPHFSSFETFKKKFDEANNQCGKKQQLIPYFISSHPGCTINHMRQLSSKLQMHNIQVEQVQDFTPTPLTLSNTMYYTGINPYSGESIFIEKDKPGKDAQKALFFTNNSRPPKKR